MAALQINKLMMQLSSVDGLANYGSPRFWPRCEGELVGSIHIQLAPSPSSYDPSRPSHTGLGGGSSHGRGETIYANSDKVVARVDKVLKSRIRGLKELVIQIEGGEEKGFCTCMTGN